MKAMILAAGRGERMRPFTLHTHKCLLPVDGQTLIERHLRRLAQAGIHDVLINVSYLAEQIQQFVGDGHSFGVKVNYSVESDPLEVGGGIITALPQLGSEPFIIINADVICDYPYEQLADKLKGQPAQTHGHIVLVNNPPHHPQGDFSLQDHQVYLQEQNDFTYSGIGIFQPTVFADFPAHQKQAMLPILTGLIEKEALTGEAYQGQWFDIGSPERLAFYRNNSSNVMT